MRINRLLLSLVLLTTSAVPQKSAPPPSGPADSASLEVTMKFIQDKLNAVGNVNYTAHWHDYVDDTDGILRYSFQASNVVANPANCWIKYHLKIVTGTGLNDRDNGFFLPDVQGFVVTKGEQYENERFVAIGYPSISAKVDPPIFWLVARRPENSQLSVWRKPGENAFVFTDEETANGVAKAMLHAVELCGGAAKGSETVQNGAEK